MYRIGLYGSAVVDSDANADRARKIGRLLRAHECIVITGACSGLPYLAASEAARAGREVHGFSPVKNLMQQQEFTPDDDLSIYSRLIFIPESFPFADDLEVAKKYRNVISTASCDAGIIISGRWGTLHEFCSLVDFGKVVGVLRGSGEIADELPMLYPRITKPGKAKVFFDDDPASLVDRIVAALKT